MLLVVLRAVAAILVSFSLVACDDDSGESEGTPTVSANATGEAILLEVQQDLADRLGVQPDEVSVLEYCEVTWPDGSLGVAEPGQVYTQALVEGWLAILAVDGEEYRYHGAGDRFIAADFVPDATVSDTRCP